VKVQLFKPFRDIQGAEGWRLFVAPGCGNSTARVYEDDERTQEYASEHASTTISKNSDIHGTHVEVSNSYSPSEVLFNGAPVRCSRFGVYYSEGFLSEVQRK